MNSFAGSKELNEEKSIQIRKAISGGGNNVIIQSAFSISATKESANRGGSEKADN